MHKLLLLFVLLPLMANAQSNASKQPAQTVTIACRFVERPVYVDSFFLYETIGLGSRIVSRSTLRVSDSTFLLTVPASPTPRQYGVGTNSPAVLAKLWVSNEPEITMWANFNYLDKGRTVGSP